MSLLINEAYASPSTPLWASANNPVFSGTVTATSFTTTPGGNVRVLDPSGNIGIGIVSPGSTYSYIQSGKTLLFGQPGQVSANTSLALSAPSANTDVLTVGGRIIGGGITPSTSTVGSATVTLNGTPAALTITPPIAFGANEIYDIQVSGYWSVAAGTTTPATTDLAYITLQTGTASSPGVLQYQYTDVQYPGLASAPWTSSSFHPIHIRARMPSNGATLSLTPAFTGSGTYPSSAVSIVITDLTVVRVA